jgi:hypothetical protein
MKSQRTCKAALVRLIALLFTTLAAQPVFAFTRANDITVYSTSDLCVIGSASIDQFRPPPPGGLFGGSNQATASTYAYQPGCGSIMSKANGNVATKLDVYRWTGSEWAICRSTDWTLGASGIIFQGDITIRIGAEQIFDYGGSAACGPGWYGTLGHSVVWDGSAWRGGNVWSGYEFVP